MENGVGVKFSCKTERLGEERRLDEGMREEDVRVAVGPGGNLDKRMEGFREKKKKVWRVKERKG